MAGFTMQVASATRLERFDGVSSFVGTDASGRFGLMAGHAPMSTVLSYGLARFRLETASGQAGLADGAAESWNYLALPGGVLRFADNVLSIASRVFVVGGSVQEVGRTLAMEMERDTAQQVELRRTLQRLEQTLMKGLWQLESR